MACPHCQTHLTMHPSRAGQIEFCSSCGGKFQVPVPTATSAPVASPDYTMPIQSVSSGASYEVEEFCSRKIAAGICAIMLGGFGVHKFILGLNTSGIIMLVLTLFGIVAGACFIIPILAPMVMGVIGLVEGIIYLSKSDQDFYRDYAVLKKEWF